MQILKLKLTERFGIVRLLNECYAQKGLDLKGLNTATKIVGKVVIGEEEKKKIDFKEKDGRYNWNVKKEASKDFEFTSDEAKMIKELIERKATEKTIGLNDTYIVGVAEQLDLIKKEEGK